jgi:hypothetical protein
MAAIQSAISQLSEMLSVPYTSQVSVFATPEIRIATRLLRIPQVESVFVDRSSEIIRVWTVIDHDDEAVCDAIYSQEQYLIQDLQEQFDFHVIARGGRELRSLITLNCGGWARS